MNLLAVAPVDNKFFHLRPSKVNVDIGELNNIKHIVIGLPVVGNGFWLAVVLERMRKSRPLLFNMANKFRVPCTGAIASLLPVQHKFRNRVLNKTRVNPCSSQNVHGI